jgi:hypothetical protein
LLGYRYLCQDCGAIVHHAIMQPTPVYCRRCSKLNATKSLYAAQQKQKRAQGGKKSMTYSGRSRSSSYTQTQQQTQKRCTFRWDVQTKAYDVVTPYDPNFVEFLKAKIPVSDRVPNYDPLTRKHKSWLIQEAWFDALHYLAEQLWPGAVEVITRADAERAWQEQENARAAAIAAQRQAVLGPFESALLDFCTLCDVDALRAARNKMAVALHPDKGGDPTKMAKLNASWFTIETEFKKRSESK